MEETAFAVFERDPHLTTCFYRAEPATKGSHVLAIFGL